ncbi:DUF2255 family protein [Thermoflavifilum thermophilum]|uniref:DUF2255 family protein n=1 Tax=Thermoflavifilum thermophilum TaxID=1393122 RepID=A0A1I7NAW7_9BACT|nr:DUF2255 family protein [Thermoflavifilum thermophilum]SFV31723.1 hypothetical protein SAMN05660895_1158 [Thermoflavifilum thermophilum]
MEKTSWTKDVLRQIVEADDLHISPLREDGITYGTPTWIWCVAVEGELYVRAYHGLQSSWYRAAVRQQAGRIRAAGQTWQVRFEPVNDSSLLDRIDEAYRIKYKGSPYLNPMIGTSARAATVRIIPDLADISTYSS